MGNLLRIVGAVVLALVMLTCDNIDKSLTQRNSLVKERK